MWMVVVLVLGCGAPFPDTNGDVALGMGEAVCQGLADCNDWSDVQYDICADAFVTEICSNADCAAPVFAGESTRADWNTCLDELERSAYTSCLYSRDLVVPRECTLL